MVAQSKVEMSAAVPRPQLSMSRCGSLLSVSAMGASAFAVGASAFAVGASAVIPIARSRDVVARDVVA